MPRKRFAPALCQHEAEPGMARPLSLPHRPGPKQGSTLCRKGSGGFGSNLLTVQSLHRNDGADVLLVEGYPESPPFEPGRNIRLPRRVIVRPAAASRPFPVGCAGRLPEEDLAALARDFAWRRVPPANPGWPATGCLFDLPPTR